MDESFEAVRHKKVLPYNAMREVRPAKASVTRKTDRDPSRAFSREERAKVFAFAQHSKAAHHADVVDLIHFLGGTGVRISEALGQLWLDADLEAGTVLIRGTKDGDQSAAPHAAAVAREPADGACEVSID